MSTPPRPRLFHVERTADPAVLRFVCHHPALTAAAPGRRATSTETPLHALVVEGSIDDIAVRDGDVFVRAADPAAWATLAPRVRAALLAELEHLDAGESADHWLLHADAASPAPSIAEIQEIVDTAAGAVIAAHGGTITVTSVDRATVVLRPEGACDGCHRSDDTLLGAIAPAIRSAHPDIVEIALGTRPEAARQPRPASEPVRLPRRIRPAGRGSCH